MNELPLLHNLSSSQSFNFKSPGFFLQTPSNNPFSMFSTPQTPKSLESSFASLGGMESSKLDEFQVLIQREIESNLRGENKSMSTTTIGQSPGSAFSYYHFWRLILWILFELIYACISSTDRNLFCRRKCSSRSIAGGCPHSQNRSSQGLSWCCCTLPAKKYQESAEECIAILPILPTCRLSHWHFPNASTW